MHDNRQSHLTVLTGFWDTSPYQHENTLQAQHHVLSWLEKLLAT
jgi:hypothetical protein